MAVDSQNGRRGAAGIKKMLLKTEIVLKVTRYEEELGENWEGMNKVKETHVSWWLLYDIKTYCKLND